MITQKIDSEEEFINPNVNYNVLMSKLRAKIINLEQDVVNIQDPNVKGYAYQELLKTRKEYFNYLKVDLELQHLVLSNPEIYERGEDE